MDNSLITGPQSVTVTAHVQNWTDGTVTITVLDNDMRICRGNAGTLFALLRLLGKRELGQMTPFEVVVLVVMGDLIQQGITHNDFSLTGAILSRRLSVMPGLQPTLATAQA